MPILLKEPDVNRLISERKLLQTDRDKSFVLKLKQGHKEHELKLQGANGSNFIVILRQAEINPLDFSVILGYCVPVSNQIFRLKRYNGKSHEHTNKLEGDTFYDFHIHTATERYQDSGYREDAFAQITDRYSDFLGATDCLLADCGFEFPPRRDQMPLFVM